MVQSLSVCALVPCAKYNEKWFLEIVDEPWWFLDEFWWVLIGVPLNFESFKFLCWLPGYLGFPPPSAPLVWLPHMVCEGFKETLTPKPPYQLLTGLMV